MSMEYVHQFTAVSWINTPAYSKVWTGVIYYCPICGNPYTDLQDHCSVFEDEKHVVMQIHDS